MWLRLRKELGSLRTAEARLHAEVVCLKAGGMLECRASVAAVCRTVGMEDAEKKEAGGEIAWRRRKLQAKKAAKKEEKAQRRKLSKKTGTAGLTNSLASLNLSNALDEGGGAFDDILGDALDVAVGISDTLEGAVLEAGVAVVEGVDQARLVMEGVDLLFGADEPDEPAATDDPCALAWPRFVPVRRP